MKKTFTMADSVTGRLMARVDDTCYVAFPSLNLKVGIIKAAQLHKDKSTARITSTEAIEAYTHTFSEGPTLRWDLQKRLQIAGDGYNHDGSPQNWKRFPAKAFWADTFTGNEGELFLSVTLVYWQSGDCHILVTRAAIDDLIKTWQGSCEKDDAVVLKTINEAIQRL